MKVELKPRMVPDPERFRLFIRKSDQKRVIVYTGWLINDTTEDLGVKSGEFANSVPVPTALTATGRASDILVNWDGVIHDGLLGYEIYRNGVLIKKVTGTSYVDENVVSGTNYTYYVRAYDIYGDKSPQSNSDTAAIGVQFPPPTNLAGVVDHEEVTLTWDAPTDDTPDSYEVAQDGIVVATITHPTTTATITGLTNGEEYLFAVRAVYATDKSNYTDSIALTPIADSGDIYFSTNDLVHRWTQQTQKWVDQSGNWPRISVDLELWVGRSLGNTQARVRKYDGEDETAPVTELANGTATPSYSGGVTQLGPCAFGPDGEVAVVCDVDSGSSTTMKAYLFDSGGNYVAEIDEGNAPGLTQYYFAAEPVIDQNGFLYLFARDNSGSGHNNDLHAFKYRMSDGVQVDSAIAVTSTGFITQNEAYAVLLSEDNTYVYVITRESSDLTVFRIKTSDLLELDRLRTGVNQNAYTGAACINSSGEIFFADQGGDIYKVEADFSSVAVWVSASNIPRGMSCDGSDNVYILEAISGPAGRVRKYNSAGVSQWTIQRNGQAKGLSVHPGSRGLL